MSGRIASRLRIAAAAAGGAAVLLALALGALAYSGRLDAWLTSRLTVLLAPWVRFSAAHVAWWPRPAVVLADVAVTHADPPPPGAATAATVTCRVRLAPLLVGEIEVGALRIDQLHLVIVRAGDGRLHAGGLEGLMSAPPGGAADAAARPLLVLHDAHIEYRLQQAGTVAGVHALGARLTPSGDGASFDLSGDVDDGGSVRMRGTLATLTDLAAAPFTAMVDATDLDAATLLTIAPPIEQLSADGRLRLSANVSGRGASALAGSGTIELADGSVRWTDWQTAAPLRVAAQLTWEGDRLTVSNGHLAVGSLQCGALAAESIDAAFTYADQLLTVESAELRSCNGTWRAAGAVALRAPQRIDGSIQASEVDAAELGRVLSDFGVTAALPALSAPLRLEARGGGWPGTWSGHAELQTGGDLTWSSARLEGPIEVRADVAVNGADAALSNGSLTLRRLAAGPVVGDSVQGNFALARGTATITSLRANAFGGTWTYSGTLPVNPTAAWRGELAGTQVSAAALYGALGSAVAAARVDGTLDVRAQLSGTGTNAADGTVTARVTSPQLTVDQVEVDAPAEIALPGRWQNGHVSIANARARVRRVQALGVGVKRISAAFGFGDGTLRIADLDAHAFGGRWQAAGALALGSPPTWSGHLAAHHIDLSALLDGLDPAAGGPSSTDGIADLSLHVLRGDDNGAAGSIALTLTSGTFFWNELRVSGPAQGQSGFTLHDGAVTLRHASGSATHAQYGPLPASNAAASFQLVDRRLTFDDLHFDSCGGKWTYTGYFTLAPAGRFSGQISIADANPGRVMAILGQEDTSATFDRLDFDAEFSSHAADDWLAEMHASGSVFLSGGSMPSATILRPIVEALVGSGRIMNALSAPTTHLQELSETFALRDDRFDTSDFALITHDYSITGAGSIDLDGSVDLDTRIQLTSKGVQKMFVFRSLPLPTSALPTLPPIPARIVGTVDNLIVRPNVSALPATTAEWLLDALLQTPRSIGEAITHRLGQLWGGARRLVGAGD